MRIVYCIVSTFNSGGMERVLANKANYLAKHGNELFIVTTDQKGRKPFFKLNDHIVQYDLGINYTGNKGLVRKILSYPGKQRKHRQKLSALLQQLKADVVISMFDLEVPFLYKIKDGSKKVVEIHFSRYKRLQYGNTGLLGWVDRFRSKQDWFIAQRYDRFVVLTQEDKLYWGNLKNIQVIPNANSFKPVVNADLKAKRVIAVGRYDYQKGFDELIRSWKQVHKVHPDWSLAIFGQGPLKTELQALIVDLQLEEAVQLCAPVNAIEKEYLASSILAMTSRYEGLPMALLEGQACGLPLVAYACKCGPRDIIKEGSNGFLLAEGDEEGLADKLIDLMDDAALREKMGKASLALSGDYAEDLIMKQWLMLFNQLTGKYE
ncbi:glycosyltransferase family 4 protein [Pedobacter sp. AW31-3R]|uniref:glycosyltransferase family 4 protein n=1 Tax=Pedobacter sp. AW31-3R TaxID=3445781 RepID=UPI003FA09D96